ncbi:putative disease resistance protein At1g59780 [Nicotiana tabacum]|uniref:Disease resistance protein At1g59780 n=1 Tax=Nicotiana tabacum TaxID=4097 RepID=A0AC58SJG8_TOBAC
MAESAITYLVHQLSTLLNGGQKFLEGIQEEIVHIRDEFGKMRTFSRVADAKEEKDAELQVWIKQVQDLAHDVQDILEKHVVMCNNFQDKGSWPRKKFHLSFSEKLFEAQHDNLSMLLEGIKVRIVIISEGHITFLQKYGVIVSAESRNINTWCDNHEEVVLHDDADLLEWKLHCIVGSRGIGKTTLVKKVYDDAAVKKHFNHTLWLEIPRVSDVKELMKNMITINNDHSRRVIEAMDTNMLAQFIRQLIESSRYFIVLDDVPDIAESSSYRVLLNYAVTFVWKLAVIVMLIVSICLKKNLGFFSAERSLIQVARKYPDGRLETFRIHNLWYEFILSKSRERSHKVRHLVIQDHLSSDIQDIDQFKHLRTLITLGSSASVSSSLLLKLLSGSFKLLKCLNLRSTKIKHIPGSIGKLENLEFLDLRETLVNKLPVEILKLQHRHIFINRFAAGYIHGFEAPKKIGTLVSLEMVNRINATTSTVIELGKLTRLRMLYIAKLRRKHGRDLCSSLDKLINIQQLTISSFGVGGIIDLHYPLHSTHSSLRTLVFEGCLESFPQWVTSLQALAIVVLRGSKLMDNALETLQDLPSLVKLVLDRAFEGEELRFGAGRFKKLKILCIWHSTKLRQTKVEEGAMPFLEELQLCNCGLMEDLPFGIEHLRKLGYLLLEEISEKLLMTLQLKDSQSGDYWKIAHIPKVHVKMFCIMNASSLMIFINQMNNLLSSEAEADPRFDSGKGATVE